MKAVVATVIVVLACGEFALGQCNQPGPDAVIGQVTDIGNYTPSGGYDAFALGFRICNIGSVNLQYSGCPSNLHPVVGASFYRYSTVAGASRFEQIGQS